uniref:Uncharacterized protein n=1 Tax=Anopheles farauti TaxID=69004 RepID=A0A182Q828_9DIPT
MHTATRKRDTAAATRDGWANSCEIPCPVGFYGTMCVSKCNCSTRACHLQTGACMPDNEVVMFDNITRTIENGYSAESTERISAEQWIKVDNETLAKILSSTASSTADLSMTTSSTTTSTTSPPTPSSTTTSSTTTEATGQLIPNATYAESYHEYLPNNTEISMVLTKGHSRSASNESMYELVTTTSRVEITFIDTAVQKIEDPSTIGNGSAQEDADLMRTLTNDSSNETDTPLVYVESENHPVLVGITGEDVDVDGPEGRVTDDRQALVTISCLLITLALLMSVVVYMKRLNKKTLAKPIVNPVPLPPVKIVDESVQTGTDPSNRSSDPLPDLPHVTYTRVKPKPQRNGDIEHYDVPANNSFIHRAKSSPYNYNFSVNQKAAPRKYSLEHIYDEIQYPPLAEVTSGGECENTLDKPVQPVQLSETEDGYTKPMICS